MVTQNIRICPLGTMNSYSEFHVEKVAFEIPSQTKVLVKEKFRPDGGTRGKIYWYHPLGTMNISIKCHSNLVNSCRDILL